MAKGDIKRRREIERLSASLPSITQAQEWDAQKACASAWVGKKKAWCDACAREFDSDLWEHPRTKCTVCPHCGAALGVKRSPNKRKETVKYYFNIITTAGGWQVIRTFLCRRESQRADWFGNEILNPSEVKMDVTEVFQKFMRPDTVPMTIGLGLRGLSYSDKWKWDSGWKIRGYQTAYSVWGWMAKDQELLPELKKRGLKRLTDDASPYKQVERVFTNYQAEVMLKAGAVKLFKLFCGRNDYKIRHNWESIRIVLRHKYHRRVRDWGMWFDMMDALHENGKDRHNPHYVCPENLRRAHDEQMAILERRREKARQEKARRDAIRLAEKLNEDGKTNVAYVAKTGAMLGIVVKSGDMELKPLQNIQDFFEEGSTLNHCVFSNKYYEHRDCLIIGARVDGKRTETIEIDTKEWKIVQCRGKHNQPSPYHDKIMKLMNDNIDKYRRAAL